MFAFFRRYQRLFFLLITGVIVFSFSFFGTYSAFLSSRGEDPVVLKTVDGKKVYRSDFSDMVHFLSVDMDFHSERGERSFNPLNDSVIANDIIQTGIGSLIVKRFASSFKKEFQQKLKREKLFTPYVHPQASFLSATQVWSYFAPDIKESLDTFMSVSMDNPTEIYEKKVSLFLAERMFPPQYLRQILAYQQQQYSWVEPDSTLAYRPLGLFQYGQISDWFGTQFIDLSATFIFQAASYARMQGIKISSEEVMDALVKNCTTALQKVSSKESVTAKDLFTRALQENRMDVERVVRVYENILLFRRVLLEISNNLILSEEPFETIFREKENGRQCDLYQVQQPLRFTSMKDLYGFQAWIQAVAPANEKNSLYLPNAFMEPEIVRKSFPEFVERAMDIQYACVQSDEISSKICLKDIWNVQTSEEGFSLLQKEIPALAVKEVKSLNERSAALEMLPPQMVRKAEELATKIYIDKHPELIREALEKQPMKSLRVKIRAKGGSLPLAGIMDREAFIQVLSSVSLGDQSEILSVYTQDGKHFYKILVVDRDQSDTIVPFSVVKEDKTVDSVLARLGEAAYPKIRETTKSSCFKDDAGGWKPFAQVEEQVYAVYFEEFLKNLDQKRMEYAKECPSYCHFDDIVASRIAVRFIPHMNDIMQRIKHGEDEACFIVQQDEYAVEKCKGTLLNSLWRLEKTSKNITKEMTETSPYFSVVLTTAKGAFAPLVYSQTEGPQMIHVKDLYHGDYSQALRTCIYAYREALGKEAILEKSASVMDQFFPLSSKE